jgi:hypothetical protein
MGMRRDGWVGYYRDPGSRICLGSILLKKSGFRTNKIFQRHLARPYENYVGGHIVRPISNRQPS